MIYGATCIMNLNWSITACAIPQPTQSCKQTYNIQSACPLQEPDKENETEDVTEEDQEAEIWEDVSLEDLLGDVGSSEPCPEPTPKQTRMQKWTALVQWLVYFILMWQSLCNLSDNSWNGYCRFF